MSEMTEGSLGFTPGPWTADSAGEIGLGIFPGDHEFADRCIAQCLPCDNHNYKADAHLIAAAPELYEALSRIVQVEEAGSVPMATFQEAMAMGRAALAKAEGR